MVLLDNTSRNMLLDMPITEKFGEKYYFDQILNSIDRGIELWGKENADQNKDTNNSSLTLNEANENVKISENVDILTKYSIPSLSEYERRIKNYFTATQSWIGHVMEINKRDEVFTAKLIDLNNPGTHEIGEFEIADVSIEDRDLIETGSVFYWSLGRASVNMTIKKESLIRFQRIAHWDEVDFNAAADRAIELNANIVWEEL